jgi:hypothetical protein
MNGLSQDLDYFADDDQTYSATEDSAERGYSRLSRASGDPLTYANLGRGEGLDSEGVGDIADEGRGHRG